MTMAATERVRYAAANRTGSRFCISRGY